MSFRVRLGLVMCAIVFSATVGAWASAQVAPRQPIPPGVVSGSDLGLRLEGPQGNGPVGKLVVRVNGQWVEARFSGGVKPAIEK